MTRKLTENSLGIAWAYSPPEFAVHKGVRVLQPEFADHKGVHVLFGFSRSHLYLLASQGLIRSVSIRRTGTTRGRRLYDCASIRNFLNKRATGGEQEGKAQLEGKREELSGEASKSYQRDSVSGWSVDCQGG
jgi:hypothetical protein